MQVIDVKTSRPYRVHIGAGLLAEVPALLAPLASPPRKVLIVSDSNVAPLYLQSAKDALQGAGYDVSHFVVEAGEASKNFANAEKILAAMADAGFDRSDLVAALGGGVVGDLAGFAAAMYMRGIELVQIPTTVLAAVDSSVGGKTAVDLPQGKNLAGAFHQPVLVVCDVDCFRTLPREVYSAGLAEAVKAGIVEDRQLFGMLAQGSFDIETVVARSVAFKARVVERDERDEGGRAVLNLGHTIAHAVEKLSDYEISHGEAVAIGLYAMAKLGGGKKLAEQVYGALAINGLPHACDIPAEQIAAEIVHDKKKNGDRITLAVPHAVGDCRLVELPLAEAQRRIEEALKEE